MFVGLWQLKMQYVQCLATQKATSNINETVLHRLLAQTSSIGAENGAKRLSVIN